MRLLALGLAVGFSLSTPAAAGVCRDDRVTVIGDWGQAHFTITVADDPQERGQGLMHVPQMPLMTGMLFVFDRPQRAVFWMKNTLIPLDMIFAGADGRVLRVHANAIPHDESPIDGGDGVLAVLEINGGLAARLGIAEGDVLRHAAFGAAAAAPCDP